MEFWGGRFGPDCQRLCRRRRSASEVPVCRRVLRRPFHVARRGGPWPGGEPAAHFPVLAGDVREKRVCGLRYCIEVGAEPTPCRAESLFRIPDILCLVFSVCSVPPW